MQTRFEYPKVNDRVYNALARHDMGTVIATTEYGFRVRWDTVLSGPNGMATGNYPYNSRNCPRILDGSLDRAQFSAEP